MDKETFVNQVDVDESTARSAWEEADGDESVAKDLLTPETLKVKGNFSVSSQSIYGLFAFSWKVKTSTPEEMEQVVVAEEDDSDISLSMEFNSFLSKLENAGSSGSTLGGLQRKLGDCLSDALRKPDSSLVESLSSGDQAQIEEAFESLLANKLDLEDLSVEFNMDIDRAIDTKEASSGSQSDSSSGSAEEDKVTFECEAEINPVRGIPVTEIEPGHEIYVSLDSSAEEQHYSLVKKLREQIQEDNDLLPAHVTSRESTDAGQLRINVAFSENVRGTLKCSNDVSVLVPEDTESRLSGEGVLKELLQNEVVIGVAVSVIVILFLAIWLFL